MRTHYLPRTQVSVLETSGLELISCSLYQLASPSLTHPLFCMGHFICLLRCQQSTSNVQKAFVPTASSSTLLKQCWHQHENLVILLGECCKSLSRVNPYSRDNSNMHGQGDHHNSCGVFHILKLPRRDQDAGIPFHVQQHFALNKSTSGIFVLHHAKLWKWGSSELVCNHG